MCNYQMIINICFESHFFSFAFCRCSSSSMFRFEGCLRKSLSSSALFICAYACVVSIKMNDVRRLFFFSFRWQRLSNHWIPIKHAFSVWHRTPLRFSFLFAQFASHFLGRQLIIDSFLLLFELFVWSDDLKSVRFGRFVGWTESNGWSTKCDSKIDVLDTQKFETKNSFRKWAPSGR